MKATSDLASVGIKLADASRFQAAGQSVEKIAELANSASTLPRSPWANEERLHIG